MFAFLLSIVSGLAADGIGAGIKSETFSDMLYRLKQGESLKENRLRNHHLQRGVIRSYLNAIKEVNFLCIQEKNITNEYVDEFSISFYEDQMSLINKEIKKIDKINDLEIPIGFAHLRYLIMPEQVSEINLEETNYLLINNLPDKYVVDSDLFRDKLRSNIFGLVSKYFAYEIKFNDEVRNIFMAQLAVLQNEQGANISDSTLAYIDKLAVQVKDTKNEIIFALGTKIQEEGEKTREYLNQETTVIKDTINNTHGETKKLIEGFIGTIKESRRVTYLLKVSLEGYLVDSEDEFYDTIYDLREEAKQYALTSQIFEFMNEVSFDVFLDEEAQVYVELVKLDNLKRNRNWTTEERERRHLLKNKHTNLLKKKKQIKKNILAFVFLVTKGSASLSMGLIKINKFNQSVFTDLSLNIIRCIVEQQVTRKGVPSYLPSGYEEIDFLNVPKGSFSIVISQSDFELFDEKDYYLTDIKNPHLLTIILPQYISNIAQYLDPHCNDTTKFVTMGNWHISHSKRNKIMNEKLMNLLNGNL